MRRSNGSAKPFTSCRRITPDVPYLFAKLGDHRLHGIERFSVGVICAPGYGLNVDESTLYYAMWEVGVADERGHQRHPKTFASVPARKASEPRQ